MRTYYRGPDAVVTEKYFVWRTSPAKVFVIEELRDIELVRGRPGGWGSGEALIAMAAVVTLTSVGWTLGGVVVALPAALVGSVLAGTLAANRRRATRSWYLQAYRNGGRVTLYSAVDARVFNQVTRALRRAVEDSRRPRDVRGLVVA
ncbi:DUF6232 family protein [Couchioplanes azureus]|uniref:DUF6232 family protein n=1 Tax=Couchioplanes caeruleus TaxID=56438 RepID=UPI00167132EF|nr:DUF6232 family protein [Couchioplanes caeruleus]GGQ69805.1 hypothetical protein GCM10010166_44540 [Couchioplanes caeruleus subsp. azureus]